MYVKRVLPNGVRIISERLDTMRTVSVGIWVGNGSRYGLRKVTRCRVPSKAATLWDVSNSDSELKLSYTATRNSRDYNLPAVAKKWTSGCHAGGFDNILFVDGHAGCFNIAKLVDHVSFLYSAFMPDSEDIGSLLWPC